MVSRHATRAERSRLRVLERLREAAGAAASAEARDAARHLLGSNRGDDELRRALAEHCRARGADAQAARWGITTPGWAEASEIRALRHWLLGRGDDSDVVRDLLLLASDRPLPAELADLVPPSLRDPRRDPPSSPGSACWWFLLAVLAAVIGFGSGTTLLLEAAAGDADLVSSARAAALMGGVAWMIAAAGALIGRSSDRREQRRLDEYRAMTEEDRDFAIGLARRLSEAGDRRAGEILLRARVRWGDDEDSRRLLVRWARDDRRSDQAGRWGAPIDGATTVGERQAYAASLARTSPDQRAARIRDLSACVGDLSGDTRDVLRRAGRISGDGAATQLHRDTAVFSPAWWWASPVLVVVGTLTVFVFALADNPATAMLIARSTIAGGCVVLGLMILVASLRWRRPERRSSGVGIGVGLGLTLLGCWLVWLTATGE